MSSTIRVSVHLSVEVDREAWELAYGSQPTQGHLRDDVKEYVLDGVQNSAAAGEGGIVRATLR